VIVVKTDPGLNQVLVINAMATGKTGAGCMYSWDTSITLSPDYVQVFNMTSPLNNDLYDHYVLLKYDKALNPLIQAPYTLAILGIASPVFIANRHRKGLGVVES